MTDPWQAQVEALGAFIRSQRKLANLSLRQMAELTSLSNPYLSQIERGLHQPSVRVLKLIADALDVSAEALLAQAGLVDSMAAGQDENGSAVPMKLPWIVVATAWPLVVTAEAPVPATCLSATRPPGSSPAHRQ